MARLALLSWGSHGDVLPLVALARALRTAGHQVVLGAQPYHGDFIRRHGIEFHALGGETSADKYNRLMDTLIVEANPRKQMRTLLQEMLLPDLEAQYRDALAAVGDADLVVAHWMQLAGMMAAEQLGKPCATVSLNPVGISVVANAAVAANSSNAAARNLGKMLSDYIWGDEFHRLRARHGLPAIESVADYQYSKQLNLVAVSSALLPERGKFEAQHRVTGFWPLQDERPWTPPRELEAFLAAGEPPVVISFGSMGGRAEEMTAIVVEAVRLAGCRAILQGGWAGLGAAGLSGAWDHILRVDYVPHEVLFREAACVVHHGGAGTTAAALRAGVPSVIVWHMLDQPYWGNLLASLELGPRPLARLNLCAADLAGRIGEVLANPAYRENCLKLARQLAAEQGVDAAVREITSLLATGKRAAD